MELSIMGTRSETAFYDSFGGAEQEVCRVYRQMDGYPSSHGLALAQLCNVTMVNGISDRTKKIANGMGCLAAQVIAGLKDGPGSIYMAATATPLDEEYIYEVRGTEGSQPVITCKHGDDVVFSLPAKEAIKFCTTQGN